MAAAAPWTTRVRERAVEAQGRCLSAGGVLAKASAHLALPVPIADAESGRTRLLQVRDMLADASRDLSFAGSATAAAELLALCGGATSPTTPLASIEHLPDGYGSVRRALGFLQSARICAEHACDSVEWCCYRLCVAYHLLEHPGLPGVDGFVDAERVAAHGHLEAARDLTGVSAEVANAARSLLVLSEASTERSSVCSVGLCLLVDL